MLPRLAVVLSSYLLLLGSVSACPAEDAHDALRSPSQSFDRSVEDTLALRARSSAPSRHAEGHGASARQANPGDFRWTELADPARAGHVAVFDARRRQLIVFGGRVSEKYQGLESRNDVWILKLGDKPVWERIEPIGTPPTPRADAAGVYDSIRERLLVFGGKDSSGLLNDVWELSLKGRPRWQRHHASSAPWTPRYRHTATLDEANNRVLLFGGQDEYWYTNDLWQLDLFSLAWTRLLVNGPGPRPRAAHTAVLAGGRKQLIVFGGAGPVICPGPFTCAQNTTDVWALSLIGEMRWTELTPPAIGPRPCGIQHHSASYDAVDDRMIVVGGYAAYGADFSCFGGISQTWSFSLRDLQWSLLEGSGPRARYFSSALVDEDQGRVLVYGGGGGTPYSDVWALTLRPLPTWTRIVPAEGIPEQVQYLPPMLHYDRENDRLITATQSRLWSYPLGHGGPWTSSEIEGALPSFYSAVEVLDAPRRRLIRHGINYFGGGAHGETWQLPLEHPLAWSRIPTDGEAPTNLHAAAVFDPVRSRVIVTGGLQYSWPFDPDVWELSLEGSPRWTQLATAGSWRPRGGHSSVYDEAGDRVVVFGGGGPDADSWWTMNDVWALALSGSPQWSRLNEGGWQSRFPRPRALQSAVYDRFANRMIVVGGWVPGAFARGPFDDAWEFRFVDSSWHLIEPAEAVPLWRGPSGTYDSRRNRMVLLENDWLWSLEPGRARANVASTSSVTTEQITSHASPSTDIRISASNPFVRDLVLEVVLPEMAPAILELFDVTGRRVWSRGIESQNAGHLLIQGSELNGVGRGVYLLRVTQAKRSSTTRVVHLP